MKNQALEQAKTVAREKYAWPGGYELFLVLLDGEVLCYDCIRNEFKQIAYATRNGLRDGWQAEGLDSTETSEEPMLCDHCGRVIGHQTEER